MERDWSCVPSAFWRHGYFRTLNAEIGEHLLLCPLQQIIPKRYVLFRRQRRPNVLGCIWPVSMRKVHAEGTLPEPADIRGRSPLFKRTRDLELPAKFLEASSRKKGRYLPRRQRHEKLTGSGSS